MFNDLFTAQTLDFSPLMLRREFFTIQFKSTENDADDTRYFSGLKD